MDEPPNHIIKAARAMCEAEGLEPDELIEQLISAFPATIREVPRWHLYVNEALKIEAALPHIMRLG